MDFIFPQNAHDKVLACIFLAMVKFTKPLHRDILDLVMTVKESHCLSHFAENISNTKVRGVFGLLKYSNVLETAITEGEHARLKMNKSVKTFSDLKIHHDETIKR
jgi:hypothetical protein